MRRKSETQTKCRGIIEHDVPVIRSDGERGVADGLDRVIRTDRLARIEPRQKLIKHRKMI